MLCRERKADLLVPMSIDWAQAPWQEELLNTGTPIFSPTGEGMRIERERDFACKLCHEFKIPFPKAHVAANRLEAEKILRRHARPYVIKNPLCSPTSPIHTILCETVEDTRSWLKNINYAEGVFLQEYLGRAEAGHIALVSGGELYPVVTNQEYKRAFDGNMGVIAGAPLGGLVEQDAETNTASRVNCSVHCCHGFAPSSITGRFKSPPSVGKTSGTSSNTTSASA